MKTALITGSSRGIGLQIGTDLLNSGYFVHFNGRNLIPLKLNSSEWNFIQADMSKIESVTTIEKLLEDCHENLDVLVLNAGMTDRTPFGLIDWNKWNDVFSMSLTIPFFLVQALKDKIKPNGKIIFISSILGIVSDGSSISYGVSRAAINMLVPHLAKEFANKKITVNAIAPGFVDTDWHKSKSKEQIKRITKKILSNRFATTKEISKVALSIINNDYINGQIIRIDGGYGL
jgi:3-oxoacyl-[acyl-carrier protein] reductase